MTSQGKGRLSANAIANAIARWLTLLLMLGGAACGKSKAAQALASFKESGHSVDGFFDIHGAPLGAKKCQAGTIDQLAVLLCEYVNPEAASMEQRAAEGWFGSTGPVVVLRRGEMLFAVADRTHVDPDGKAVAALTQAFRSQK